MGYQTKHFTRSTLSSETIHELSKNKNIVLLWLAHNATLRKEFEKEKLGNIRLRAVPVDI